jgi:hypothetical protein
MVKMRSNPIFVMLQDNVVYLEDPDDGHMSITNDAENVAEYYGQHGHRIVYKDTMGVVDEIVHENGVFTDWKSWKGWSPW